MENPLLPTVVASVKAMDRHILLCVVILDLNCRSEENNHSVSRKIIINLIANRLFKSYNNKCRASHALLRILQDRRSSLYESAHPTHLRLRFNRFCRAATSSLALIRIEPALLLNRRDIAHPTTSAIGTGDGVAGSTLVAGFATAVSAVPFIACHE